jgi:hypothetical protein
MAGNIADRAAYAERLGLEYHDAAAVRNATAAEA